MAIMAPQRIQPETTPTPGVPELLFPEARRRRRRRWMVGIAVVAVCASGVGLGVTLSGGGSGDGVGHGASPNAPDPAPTLSASTGSSAELAGGRWTTLVPPHPGVVKTWELATWTGKYVIAWGSTGAATASGSQTAGSSEHGAAFDSATRKWRSIPAAPVDVTVESTAWTGHEILVWGSPSAGARRSGRNVLLALDPTTWRWKRIAAPPIPPRTGAEVVWSGTRLIVIGGHGSSITALLNGATYDPRTNRWSALPAVPRIVAGAGTKEEPVDVTAAWSTGALYVWVTRQVSRACGANCGEISAKVQALRWIPGTSRWRPGATPPESVPMYDASAVSMGKSIALLDGSSCLPEMSCPGRLSGTPELLDVNTDTWASMPANSVLNSATSFAWTGRRLIAASPYLTADGHLVGGYAAAFDPASGLWANLPALPVSAAPPSGPVLTGTVWAGSELIDSQLVLTPGHRSSTTGPSTASTLPSCPPITFPEWVGGHFCGPAPGPGSGNGLDGSCLGTETAPPCGPGMVAGRYYAYTLMSSCANDYIDGRWWRNELPGGSGPLDVWVLVNATGTGAGWIGPNGAVGFEPSTATSCS
jgi:hypothetical protein